MPFLFADNVFVGGLLTLLVPTLLLIAIAVWYVFEVKRVPSDIPPSSTALPSPEVLAAADEATEGGPAAPGATDA
jgi:hypothetical protein